MRNSIVAVAIGMTVIAGYQGQARTTGKPQRASNPPRPAANVGPVLAASDWPKFGGGLRNDCRSMGKGAVGTKLWNADLSTGKGHPVIGNWDAHPARMEPSEERFQPFEDGLCPLLGPGGIAYVVYGHTIFALDRETQAVKWEYRFTSSPHLPVIAADGTLFVGADRVYGLDGRTGAKKWAITIDVQATYGAPTITEQGVVVIGSSRGKVYGLSGATGASLWEYSGPISPSSPGISPNGSIILTSLNGDVYALQPTTGANIWRVHVAEQILAAPSVGSDGTVFISSHDGIVSALDGTTGRTKWQHKSGAVYGSIAIGPTGAVFFGANNDGVYGLDGATGEKLWSKKTRGIYTTPVVDADNVVYFCDTGNQVYAVDGKTGTNKWKYVLGGGGASPSTPALGRDGTIYVRTSYFPATLLAIH